MQIYHPVILEKPGSHTAALFLNPHCVYQIPNLSFVIAVLNIHEDTGSPQLHIASWWVFCASPW